MKIWSTIKETTGRIHPCGRNRSFIGLISWSEEEGGGYFLYHDTRLWVCQSFDDYFNKRNPLFVETQFVHVTGGHVVTVLFISRP
jgi:hypothetical protein